MDSKAKHKSTALLHTSVGLEKRESKYLDLLGNWIVLAAGPITFICSCSTPDTCADYIRIASIGFGGWQGREETRTGP